MDAPVEGLERLRGVARRLVWGALVCSVVPILAWLGSSLYSGIAPGSEDGPAGKLAVLLVMYMLPVGAVLLVLGAAASAWAWWLGRREG